MLCGDATKRFPVYLGGRMPPLLLLERRQGVALV
jgi:hypothetical protein